MATTTITPSTETSIQTTLLSYDPKTCSPVNELALKAVGTMESRSFDPSVDLEYSGKPGVHTMRDLGLAEDTGVSSVAVSHPFKLFSNQAVHRFRREVLSPRVRKGFGFTSNLAPYQLRGYAAQYVRPLIRAAAKTK